MLSDIGKNRLHLTDIYWLFKKIGIPKISTKSKYRRLEYIFYLSPQF